MRSVLITITAFVAMVIVSGCSTLGNGPSLRSLETRVEVLENRVQAVEGDIQGPVVPTGEPSFEAPRSSSKNLVSVDALTKEDIQTALKNAGYYDGVIDGKIGPKSRAAIMEFQRDMNLKADGVAGKKTKEKLLRFL